MSSDEHVRDGEATDDPQQVEAGVEPAQADFLLDTGFDVPGMDDGGVEEMLIDPEFNVCSAKISLQPVVHTNIQMPRWRSKPISRPFKRMCAPTSHRCVVQPSLHLKSRYATHEMRFTEVLVVLLAGVAACAQDRQAGLDARDAESYPICPENYDTYCCMTVVPFTNTCQAGRCKYKPGWSCVFGLGKVDLIRQCEEDEDRQKRPFCKRPGYKCVHRPLVPPDHHHHVATCNMIA